MAGKRRRINDHSPKVPRGLDRFFSKQQQNIQSTISPSSSDCRTKLSNCIEQTDEELARKLQAEWNQEDRTEKFPCQNVSSKTFPIDPDSIKPLQFASGDETVQIPNKTSNFEGVDAKKSTDSCWIEKNTKKTLSLQNCGLAEDTIISDILLDESPLVFNPSKYLKKIQNFLAAEDGNMSYSVLIRCFVLINNTSSRIKIVDTLVNFLRLLIEGDPSSLLPSVWLATNAISPPYIHMELGLGGSAISKALKNVYGLDAKSLKSIYDKVGDAGDVAFEIATIRGNGSGELKQRVVDGLLRDTRGAEESRFIIRTLCQHLRIGAVKTTMLIALSRAFQLSRPPGAKYSVMSIDELSMLSKDVLSEYWAKGEEIVKACFARRPNYSELVPNLLQVGVCEELLTKCKLALHIPLCPMLGNITRDLSEMLKKFHDRNFTCEYKYDGQRAQIHFDAQGKVSIFSRHLEVITDKYPDLVEMLPKIYVEEVSSFIMEGEVVAIDSTTGQLKDFQTLSNRTRKDVSISNIKIEVCFFAFDLMYLNGHSLLHRPFRERRKLLRRNFTEIVNKFKWVKSIDATSQDSEEIIEFFNSATENKCEGIMVKTLDDFSDSLAQNGSEMNYLDVNQIKSKDKDPEKRGRRKAVLSTYEPDKRLDCWLKIKKDYSITFDTLDLIPIAAWHGQGRKSKWWSPILLAVRNENTGSLQAVCKCISGFTDTFYKENKDLYREDGPNVLSKKPGYVEYNGGHPDVWFEPQEVFEMAYADLTQSPVYTAAIGLVSESRGLSMRFPRFLRKRGDKSIYEASTSEFLAALWNKQEARSLPHLGKRTRDDHDCELP